MTDDQPPIPWFDGWELTPPEEVTVPPLPPIPLIPDDLAAAELPDVPEQQLPSLLGLRPIESVSITGRGWRKPYTAYSIGEWGVTLQFSDSQNHEIWASVELPQEVLGEMIYAVLAQHEYTDNMTRECVKALVMKLPK